MHDSGNLVGALDHVIVGNNQAAGIDDEARPKRRRLAVLRPLLVSPIVPLKY